MIYLDSNILIYALEDGSTRGDRVRDRLRTTTSRVATSPLVLHECLVQPLRKQNFELRDRYIALYGQMEQLELDASVFLRAAELRADFGLRTPDALHLATAQLARCDEFWTNDRRLSAASRGLAIDVVG